MDTIYRLHTEDMNRPLIEKLVAASFNGFTILSGTGYWKGSSEATLVIEIIGDQHDGLPVRRLAEQIRQANDQDAVLVTAQAISTVLI